MTWGPVHECNEIVKVKKETEFISKQNQYSLDMMHGECTIVIHHDIYKTWLQVQVYPAHLCI